MQNRNYSLWVLYDFANSLAFVNVSFYFSLWLVSDHGFSDFWVSIATVASTVLLLLTLPFLSHFSDRTGKRILFLRVFTLLSILSLGILGWLAMKFPFTTTLGFTVLLFYFFFQLFFQGSFSFYNAFIQDFTAKKTADQVSGMGMGFGQLGNMIGILLVLPLAEGSMNLLGESGRGATFFASAGLFLIFALPSLLFLKDKRAPTPLTERFNFTGSLKKVLKTRGVLAYLLSYYFFADAILTLQLFVGLYLEEVAGMDDRQKTLTMVVALICGCLGAWLAPAFARWIKSSYRAIKYLILSWAILLGLFSMAVAPLFFSVLIVLNGFAFGALFALSRSYYSEITPKESQAEYFSIYVLFERAASILGPLVWSSTVLVFASHGGDKYRFAMFSLAILVAISFGIFLKVPKDKTL
ncbi:MAG: MFS transporter [Patescibacteria group bacterium]